MLEKYVIVGQARYSEDPERLFTVYTLADKPSEYWVCTPELFPLVPQSTGSRFPITPGFYEHYKHKPYKVWGVATDAESLDAFILYQAQYESDYGKDVFWVRPAAMFFEEVEWEGRKVQRFIYRGPEIPINKR